MHRTACLRQRRVGRYARRPPRTVPDDGIEDDRRPRWIGRTGEQVGERDAADALVREPFATCVDEDSGSGEGIQLGIGPHPVVGQGIAREEVAIEAIEPRRRGADRLGHLETITRAVGRAPLLDPLRMRRDVATQALEICLETSVCDHDGARSERLPRSGDLRLDAHASAVGHDERSRTRAAHELPTSLGDAAFEALKQPVGASVLPVEPRPHGPHRRDNELLPVHLGADVAGPTVAHPRDEAPRVCGESFRLRLVGGTGCRSLDDAEQGLGRCRDVVIPDVKYAARPPRVGRIVAPLAPLEHDDGKPELRGACAGSETRHSAADDNDIRDAPIRGHGSPPCSEAARLGMRPRLGKRRTEASADWRPDGPVTIFGRADDSRRPERNWIWRRGRKAPRSSG